ncbi:MAG: tetratricopeptide repeat protein [Verrucomicrobiota bacterium]
MSIDAKMLRGRHLRDLGRHEESAAFFQEAISDDVENPEGYAELALSYLQMEGRNKDALEAIDVAISLDPEIDGFHAIRSLALNSLERHKEALDAADTAISFEPESPFNHSVKAQAYCGKRDWAAAEDSARRALAIDGDYRMAENILAQSLHFQNKLDEGGISVDKMLADDPEDEMAHFNAGWAAMRRHDNRTAEKHFQEALRLDPEFQGAREGLLESFRARSSIYRFYLQYVFWMQQFSGKMQWVLIIAIYLGYRFGSAILSGIHPVLGALLMFLYLGLVIGMWLAGSLGNLLIVADSSARRALNRGEKLNGIFAGGGFVLGLLLIVSAVFMPGAKEAFFQLGLTLAIGAVPASLTFANPSPNGRLIFGGIFAATYFFGFGSVFEALINGGELGALGGLFPLTWALAALCTWIGNIPALRRERPA